MNHFSLLKSLDLAKHRLSLLESSVKKATGKLISIESSINDVHNEPPKDEHVDLKNVEKRINCIMREIIRLASDMK